MNYLVGYTGFVGSNIYNSVVDKTHWRWFNQANIQSAFSVKPDRLIYAGVQARKYWANINDHKDFDIVKNAFNNIRKIDAKQTILISSVDVYPSSLSVDEESCIDVSLLEPYAHNRRWLEEAVLSDIPNSKIVRLPALYGINIKKNFIFDIINFTPSVLSKDLFLDLSQKNSAIQEFYALDNDKSFSLKPLSQEEYLKSINLFKELNFNALHFTDSRAIYQFYPLKHLTKHLELIFNSHHALFNLAVEGISAHEIAADLGIPFTNHIHTSPPSYDCRTLYAHLLEENSDGYLFNKEYIKEDLIAFIRRYKKW